MLRRLFIFSFFVILLSLPFGSARAEENLGGFEMESIDAQVKINSDATFEVTETITGNFSDERHGLYRQIPRFYNEYLIIHKTTPIEVLSVKRDGQAEPYETIASGASLTIKIGDPEKTFSGPFVYEIKYRLARAIIYNSDGTVDWYWDIAEDQWETSVENITATISLPDGSKLNSSECFGSHVLADGRTCEISSQKNEIITSSKYYLTALIKFVPPADFYWPSQSALVKNFLSDNWDMVFLLVPIFVFFFLYQRWSKTGRDPKAKKTIIAEYEPPANLSPFEVSSLYYSGLKDTAVTATIVDLAVRGYLRIEEIKRNSDWLPGAKYKLIQIKEINDKLCDFEKDLLEKIFADGKEQPLSDCRSKLIKVRLSMDKAVWKSLISHDYFPHDPDKVRAWYIGFGGVAMVLALMTGPLFISFFERYFMAIGFGLAAIEFFVFTPLMSRRTEKGAATLNRVKGFKLFLTTAEKYRLQWQEREGIFEKFLPYAIVFGVADKWAKTFEGLMQTSPTWFHGSAMAFSFSDFNHSLNSFVSTTTSTTTPSSSSGGSSGGGFGGGGGGSW
ncbi:MAG: DUF2207 domain-containing protein [Candidatus Uhrbacteria bacterium]